MHLRLCEAWEAWHSAAPHWKAAAGRAEGSLEHPGEEEHLRHLGGRFGMVAQRMLHRAEGKGGPGGAMPSGTPPEPVANGSYLGGIEFADVLLCFSPQREAACQHTDSKNTCHMPRYASIRSADTEVCGPTGTHPVLVLANRQPLGQSHVIVVPTAPDGDAQALTENALLLGLAFATRASPRMWLHFDSAGGGAALAGHVRWEGLFPNFGLAEVFPLEAHMRSGGSLAPAALSRGPLSLWHLQAWPLRGWALTWDEKEVMQIDTGLAERRLAEFGHAVISRLVRAGVTHSVLLGLGGTAVVVFPRQLPPAGQTPGTSCSKGGLAGHELLGWWAPEQADAFHSLDEASAVACLVAAAPGEEVEARTLLALEQAGWQLTEAAA